MIKKSWYEEWFNSPYYHTLYQERDETEASLFIDHLLKYLKPAAGSNMLDVACGLGRYSKLLAQKGFFVTGTDIADNNIAIARGSESPVLEFFKHDMRLPFRINYYDYAFNFFTSFGYFRTRREHDDAIRMVSAALKPGGIFVLDYLNTHFVEERLIPHNTKKAGNTHFEIFRWQNSTHFFKRIIITGPSIREPLEFTEQVAKFSLGDFTDMFSFQQLQVKQVFGNYELQPYHLRDTPRLIIVAEKSPLH